MGNISIEVKLNVGPLTEKLKEMLEERWQVYNGMKYSEWVEFSTKPHFPPHDPLFLWAKRKMGLTDKEAHEFATALQWHIFHYGGDAHPFLRPAIDQAKETMQRDFSEGGLGQIAERICQHAQDNILKQNLIGVTGKLLQEMKFRQVK